jgi:hypothetical protein
VSNAEPKYGDKIEGAEVYAQPYEEGQWVRLHVPTSGIRHPLIFEAQIHVNDAASPFIRFGDQDILFRDRVSGSGWAVQFQQTPPALPTEPGLYQAVSNTVPVQHAVTFRLIEDGTWTDCYTNKEASGYAKRLHDEYGLVPLIRDID